MMKKKKEMEIPYAQPEKFVELRKRAEAAFVSAESTGAESNSLDDARRLLSELNIHQVELEMQNDELRQIQTQLDTEREKYADLYNFAPVAYFTVDDNDIIVDLNLAAADLLGRERKNLDQRPITPYLAPESLNVFMQARQKALECREPQTCELTIRRRDGGQVVAQARTMALMTKHDSTQLWRSVMTDMTGYKRAESALRESEARYRDILQNIQDTYIRTDKDGLIVMASPSAARAYGYKSTEDMIGVPVASTYLFLEARQAVQEQLRAYGKINDYECEFTKKDGTRFWASITAQYYYDEQGKIAGVDGFGRDITERKQAEEALQKREEQYRSTLQTAMDGYWLTDIKGRLLEVNERYCKMSGYNEQELLSMTISDFESIEDNAATARRIQNLVAIGEGRFETIHRRKDGSIFNVEVSAQYKPFDGGRLVVFLHDITKRKQREESLKQRTHELGERIKEINCLYDIVEIRNKPDISLDEMLQGIVDLLPTGWQYPEQTCARLTLNGHVFCTANFNETNWKQTSDVQLYGKQAGVLEVCYLVEEPVSGEGTFLKQERRLLNAAAERISKIIEHKQSEQRLSMQYEIARILAESSTLLEIAPQILQSICEHLGWDWGEMWRLDKQADLLRCVEIWHTPSDQYAEFEAETRKSAFKIGHGLPGRVWANDGKPIWVTDVVKDEHFARASVAQNVGLHTDLAFPIRLRGETLGVMTFLCHEIYQPDEALLQTLTAISRQIGQFMERKKDEESLKLQSVALNAAANAITITDKSGTIEWINPAWAALTGYSSEEAVGQNPRILKSGVQDHKFYENMWATILAGKVWTDELTNKRKDGTFYIEQQTITPVLNDKGKVTHFIAIKQDISQRKKSEENLQLRSAALDAAANAITITDKNGHIQWVNPAWCALTGYSPEEAIGQTLRILKSGVQDQKFYEKMWKMILTGKVWKGELVNKRKDGSLQSVEQVITPVTTGNGEITHFISIKQDITARKQAEDSLLFAHDQAVKASKLKSQLVAKVSHELRTPLSGVLGYAELLKYGSFGEITAEQMDAADQIIEGARYLTEMINEFLDESEIESKSLVLENSPFSPADLLRQVESIMSIIANKKGLALKTRLAEELPETLLGDARRLQQILINLTGNAIKFTRSGKIDVQLTRYSETQWAICVKDTGAGIPKDAQQYIFEPFRQVDNAITRENQGTGLGLTITKQLVELMNGKIMLDSEMGRGSVFTIILPIQKQTAELTGG